VLGAQQLPEEDSGFNPAYAWWTEWFPAEEVHGTSSPAENEAHVENDSDEAYLQSLSVEELHREAQVRQEALMHALGNVGNVAGASDRVKRARAEIANKSRQEGHDQDASYMQDFSSGGFF
jgi:hypothetical protein